MEMSQFKKSMQEIGRVAKAMVEEKLGDRSQVEEQVRTFAKQVEAIVGDAVKTATVAASQAAANVAANVANAKMQNAAAEKVTLKFKKLAHFKGELPSYQTEGSSGMDVRACIKEEVNLAPGERVLIPTGLSVEIPLGLEIQVRPRSGLAIKKGLTLVNTPGTIDADYRGEIKIILINLGKESFVIQDQERIAQLVVCPIVQPHIEVSEDLSITARGAGGFGSTGV
jgi:dUTP pyrophosphatase